MTGDDSIADNHISKEVDHAIKIVLTVYHPAVLQDLCVNNRQTEKSFENYWCRKSKNYRMTVIGDRQHGLPTGVT